MNLKRIIMQLGIAALLAVITGYVTLDWLQSRPREVITEISESQTVPVVVASVDIAPGTRIDKQMLSIVRYLSSSRPKTTYSELKEVEGRVTVHPIGQSEPITSLRLASDDVKQSGVGALITPGKRAVAVKGNKVLGLSGFIRPGDIVDVLATMHVNDKLVTKVVLQNLKVLATGEELSANRDGQKPFSVDVYTLEVTPEESETLALAASSGSLHFALRHNADATTVLTDGADQAKALSAYRGKEPSTVKAIPRKEREGYRVEVLKGNDKQTVHLK